MCQPSIEIPFFEKCATTIFFMFYPKAQYPLQLNIFKMRYLCDVVFVFDFSVRNYSNFVYFPHEIEQDMLLYLSITHMNGRKLSSSFIFFFFHHYCCCAFEFAMKCYIFFFQHFTINFFNAFESL